MAPEAAPLYTPPVSEPRSQEDEWAASNNGDADDLPRDLLPVVTNEPPPALEPSAEEVFEAGTPPDFRPLPPPVPEDDRWFGLDLYEHVVRLARAWFLGRDPTFGTLFLPFVVLALVLYSRWPGTNYIFDEQEALLANPYVNATGGLRYVDAIHRDFWGLAPDRSIGSYRPIPNLFWRALWQLSAKSDGLFRQPFLHHIYNIGFHAINATVLALIVFRWTKRRDQAVLAGLLFTTCAVLTEAITGIVGIADVLGGMGALFAILALSLPAWAMPFSVFTAVAFGLFCKESALVCVPLVPFCALLAAPLTHPERPARFLRALLAFIGAASAFYLYVELRKRWFPSPLPADLAVELPAGGSFATRAAHDFLAWFHQAPLPRDPLNNPLINADRAHRIAGALRIYARGLLQLVYPSPLSGDYSYPQEPIPETLVFPGSVAGAALTLLPPVGSAILWIVALVREHRVRRASAALRAFARTEPVDASNTSRPRLRIAGLVVVLVALGIVALDVIVLRPSGRAFAFRGLPLWTLPLPFLVLGLGLLTEGLPTLPRPDWLPFRTSNVVLVAIGMTWVVVSYFPHSNIPVLLPTVRAERFWYFPAIGSTLVLAVLWTSAHAGVRRVLRKTVPVALGVFILFQCAQAYRHAMDYRSDLDFWHATKDAVPYSAKAHLNYSVMKGARRDLETRLVESRIALSLAPDWTMAHIYTGDTLCRMKRASEAWPYYRDGFKKGPNDLSLIALALQCLYDEQELVNHDDDLRALAQEHPGSWLAFLAVDTLDNHEKHKGVDPKYRPRGYNEGPKE